MQGELERVLSEICGEPVRITGAGRTDAGVHATGQVIDFRTASALSAEAMERGVNALLPEDIAISMLEPAADTFHPRFSATGRTYEYRIRTEMIRDPLERLRELHHAGPLDVDAMRRAAGRLIGRHDFTAFAAGQSGTRDVRRAIWEGRPGGLRFEIEANAFLRGMVRRVVGTLLWVGRGKISVERFGAVLDSRDPAQAGPSAPPNGLCLIRVNYDLERSAQIGERKIDDETSDEDDE